MRTKKKRLDFFFEKYFDFLVRTRLERILSIGSFEKKHMEFIQTLTIQEIDFAIQVNSSIPSRQVESKREKKKERITTGM